MKRTSHQIHTFVAVGITAAFVLATCAACSKENKAVPAMAAVSSDSVSSDIGLSTLMDSMVSSTASAASSSTSSRVANSSSSSSSATSKSTSGTTTVKPSGGSTTGGSTTKPNGGPTTVKPSGGTSNTDGVDYFNPNGGGYVDRSIRTVSYYSTYGCQGQAQYDYVRSCASAVSYSQDDFKMCKEWWDYDVPYTDALNKAVLLICNSHVTQKPGGSVAKESEEDAYSVYTGAPASCVGRARAKIATLHTHGYNAKVVYGQNSGGGNHAWVTFYCNGTWYAFDGKLVQGNAPKDYHIHTISYQ